jgi:hypothetical protein
MPFKSKSQQRFMFAAESRGELPQGMAKRWARHTKNIKKLPEKVPMKDKTAASGCSMTAKKKKYQAKMAQYLQHLAGRARTTPGIKSAGVDQMHKLATAFASSGNLIDAMRVSHPNLTDPVRHKLAAALVRNCLAHDKRSTVMLGTAAPARTPAKAPSSTSTVPAAGGVSALAAAGA